MCHRFSGIFLEFNFFFPRVVASSMLDCRIFSELVSVMKTWCYDGFHLQLYLIKIKKIVYIKVLNKISIILGWFYGTSTIGGYLMPIPFLYIKTVLFKNNSI